jgi:hypothetical protein
MCQLCADQQADVLTLEHCLLRKAVVTPGAGQGATKGGGGAGGVPVTAGVFKCKSRRVFPCREAVVNRALDRVRQKVAAELGEVPSDAAALTWVTDFPMFEWCAQAFRVPASGRLPRLPILSPPFSKSVL